MSKSSERETISTLLKDRISVNQRLLHQGFLVAAFLYPAILGDEQDLFAPNRAKRSPKLCAWNRYLTQHEDKYVYRIDLFLRAMARVCRTRQSLVSPP